MWITRSLLTAGLALAGVGLAAGAPAIVTATAELRAGPGPRYDLIGRLPAGTAVETAICSGGWCRTQYGYVSAGLIGQGTPAAAAVPVDSMMSNNQPGSTVSMTGTRTTIGTVNVRAGAGTDFEIVKTLPDATSVRVQGCANGWCQIDGGYVSLYVLSRGPVQQVLPPEAQPRMPDPTSPVAVAAGPFSLPGQASVPAVANARGGAMPESNATTTANTNVRAGPGTGYERLGTLPAGSPVAIESCSGGWCLTQYGYVSARLVGRAPGRFRAGTTRPRAAVRAPTLGYWGARPSYWGGRPSYWRPHPAYPLPERT